MPTSCILLLLFTAVGSAALVVSPIGFDRALVGGYISLVLLVFAAFIAFVGYSLVSIALREDAGATCVISALLIVALLITGRYREGPAPATETSDDGDDDGGQRRRTRPEPPQDRGPSGPPAPEGPGIDWDAFDSSRREWDRVPAGVS